MAECRPAPRSQPVNILPFALFSYPSHDFPGIRLWLGSGVGAVNGVIRGTFICLVVNRSYASNLPRSTIRWAGAMAIPFDHPRAQILSCHGERPCGHLPPRTGSVSRT